MCDLLYDKLQILYEEFINILNNSLKILRLNAKLIYFGLKLKVLSILYKEIVSESDLGIILVEKHYR